MPWRHSRVTAFDVSFAQPSAGACEAFAGAGVQKAGSMPQARAADTPRTFLTPAPITHRRRGSRHRDRRAIGGGPGLNPTTHRLSAPAPVLHHREHRRSEPRTATASTIALRCRTPCGEASQAGHHCASDVLVILPGGGCSRQMSGRTGMPAQLNTLAPRPHLGRPARESHRRPAQYGVTTNALAFDFIAQRTSHLWSRPRRRLHRRSHGQYVHLHDAGVRQADAGRALGDG